MEFISNVLKFLFNGGDLKTMSYPSAIFALTSGFMGFLCVLVDFIHYNVRKGQSFLKLEYIKAMSTLRVFVFWSIGSAIMGFLAILLDIFQLKLFACFITGISWPVIFTKFAKQYVEGEPSQKIDN